MRKFYLFEIVSDVAPGVVASQLGHSLEQQALPENTNAGEGMVRRRVRLGGLLSFYHREAG